MEFKFNVTGKKRKELVSIIAGITGENIVYTRTPEFSYKIGELVVTSDGTFVTTADTGESVIGQILDAARNAGFIPEGEIMIEREQDEDAPSEDAAAENDIGLIISFPLDQVNMENLQKILDAKGTLIKKALGIESLPVEAGETCVSFPWFDEIHETDEGTAYTHFIEALCRMSLEQKRVTATEHEVENEKYAFRCFLLRLGFVGDEYKKDRKILLGNLSGSSAFKSGSRREAASAVSE